MNLLKVKGHRDFLFFSFYTAIFVVTFYKYKSVNKYIFRELHLNEIFLCFFLEVYPNNIIFY